jgi:hypothetical protein
MGLILQLGTVHLARGLLHTATMKFLVSVLLSRYKSRLNLSGPDCSINIPPDVPRGISCGFVSSGYVHIGCEGHDPRRGCPNGYSTVCFNDNSKLSIISHINSIIF